MRNRPLPTWMRLVVLFLCTTGAAYCSRPTATPTAPPVDALPPQTASSAGGSGATEAPSASSAPSAKTPPPPEPSASVAPARGGAPGDTRGTISCGTTRCKAPGQACFLQKAAWVCREVSAPNATDAIDTPLGDDGLYCDDGSDCPDGQTCCNLFGNGKQLCVARGDVSSLCAQEVCMKGGARCPTGRTCTAERDGEEGSCKAPEGPATCAGKRRCPNDRPICALRESGPLCVAQSTREHDGVPGASRYRCTHQRDCGAGDACQFVYGEGDSDFETYCGAYAPGYRGSVVCDPTEPSPCGNDPECLALNQCQAPTGPVAKYLPWLGVL